MEPEAVAASVHHQFVALLPGFEKAALSFRQLFPRDPRFDPVKYGCCLLCPIRLLLPGRFHKTAAGRGPFCQEILFLIDPVRTQPGFYIGAPGMLAEKGRGFIILVPQLLQGGIPGFPPDKCPKAGAVNPPGPLPAVPDQADLPGIGANAVDPGIRQVPGDDGHMGQVTFGHFPVKIIHGSADDLRLRAGRPGFLRHFPD